MNCKCGCHPALEGCGDCCSIIRLRTFDHLIDHCQDGIEKCFDRIEMIEPQLKALMDVYKDLSLQCANLIDYKIRQMVENNKLYKRILDLEELVYEVRDDNQACNKTPHKCPVCEGCGNDKGTTESNPNFEFCQKYAGCHACEGKGIVWG